MEKSTPLGVMSSKCEVLSLFFPLIYPGEVWARVLKRCRSSHFSSCVLGTLRKARFVLQDMALCSLGVLWKANQREKEVLFGEATSRLKTAPNAKLPFVVLWFFSSVAKGRVLTGKYVGVGPSVRCVNRLLAASVRGSRGARAFVLFLLMIVVTLFVKEIVTGNSVADRTSPCPADPRQAPRLGRQLFPSLYGPEGLYREPSQTLVDMNPLNDVHLKGPKKKP